MITKYNLFTVHKWILTTLKIVFLYNLSTIVDIDQTECRLQKLFW